MLKKYLKTYILFFICIFFCHFTIINTSFNVFSGSGRPVPKVYSEENVYITKDKNSSYPVIDVTGSTQELWTPRETIKQTYFFVDDENFDSQIEQIISLQDKKYLVGNPSIINDPVYPTLMQVIFEFSRRLIGTTFGGKQTYTIDPSIETLYIKADTNILSKNIRFFTSKKNLIKNLCFHGNMWRFSWFSKKTWNQIETLKIMNRDNSRRLIIPPSMKNFKYLELYNCKHLKSIEIFSTSLEIIEIDFCDNIEKIMLPDGQNTKIIFRTTKLLPHKLFNSINKKNVEIIAFPLWKNFNENETNDKQNENNLNQNSVNKSIKTNELVDLPHNSNPIILNIYNTKNTNAKVNGPYKDDPIILSSYETQVNKKENFSENNLKISHSDTRDQQKYYLSKKIIAFIALAVGSGASWFYRAKIKQWFNNYIAQKRTVEIT